MTVGSASDYLENKVLDHVFKVAPFAQPTNIYVALCKSTIDDTHTGTTLPGEPTGGGYERTACNVWSPSTGGVTVNENNIIFPEATADWGMITDIALCDAQTNGNVLSYCKLYNYKAISEGDGAIFEAGSIHVSVVDGAEPNYLLVVGTLSATSSASGRALKTTDYDWLEVDNASRIVDWSKAGVWYGGAKGIPTYNVGVDLTGLSSYGGYTLDNTGVNDSTAAIQAAINDCPNYYAVYLPAGSFRISTYIDILNRSVVLRGSGPTSTFLMNYGTGSHVYIHGYGESNIQTVIAGYSKGSEAVTLDGTSGYAVGTFLRIDQDNDLAVVAGSVSARCVAQLNRVIGKNGNILTLQAPLYYEFNPSMNIKSQVINGTNCIYSGVENIGLKTMVTSSSGASVCLQCAQYCWIKNVYSYKPPRWHFRLDECYGCAVVHSALDDCSDYPANSFYGIGVLNWSTNCLVEDNIANRLKHSYATEMGSCGNVFAYNYSKDPINSSGDTTDFLMSDMEFHGNHPFLNLVEGNIVAQISPENTFGSSRNNMMFRNHMTARSIPSVVYNLFGARTETNSTYNEYVGNVLLASDALSGRAAWYFDTGVEATTFMHGNYDYLSATTQWDSGIPSRDIPDSLYLSGKPSWFGSVGWPCIGPDISGYVISIPAKVRWDAYATSGNPVDLF